MDVDRSCSAVPVVNPDLAAQKARRVFDRAVARDPVDADEPVYQYRDREQVVVPSCLDQPGRELLLRAQKAIEGSADWESGAGEPDDLVSQSTLLRHEWRSL